MKNNKKRKKGEKPIKFTVSLILDKDFTKLMKASENNNTPLIFTKNRINYLEIDGIKKKPSMIQIGPPCSIFYINIKIANDTYKEVPFDKKIIEDQKVSYKTIHESEMPCIFQFILDLNKEDMSITFNISPKTNKINDLLNFEIIKKKWSDEKIEIELSGINESAVELNIPPIEFNDELIKFYKRVNYINEELNLNLTIAPDYEITQQDIDDSESLCSYIHEKKISINSFSVTCIISSNQLKDFIDGKIKQIVYGDDEFIVNLLNNQIKLEKFEIKLKNAKYLNLEELKEIYEKNKNNKEIDVPLIIGSDDASELYLNFDV